MKQVQLNKAKLFQLHQPNYKVRTYAPLSYSLSADLNLSVHGEGDSLTEEKTIL
jgi:hypothetical protein